jgi:hypothetical protein
MLLAFRTQGLRSTCEDEAVARKTYEPEVVEQLKGRLADLHAAKSVYDLVAGRLQFAPGGRSVRLSLTADYELVCKVNHGVAPRDEHGTIDWAQVSRIKIMAIERDGVHA